MRSPEVDHGFEEAIHLLVINNSEDVLRLFEDFLTDEGYRVTTQAYLDKDLNTIAEMAPI
jgi:DNA-binding response OmpR family regulator